jgi:hypothetical protein
MADGLLNINYKMCFKFYAVNNVPKNYAKSQSKERFNHKLDFISIENIILFQKNKNPNAKKHFYSNSRIV